jgi:hypothetical protein
VRFIRIRVFESSVVNDPPIFSGTRRCVSQLVGCVVSTLYLGNYPPAIHAAINILSKGIDEGTSNQHQPFFSEFEYPIVRTIRSGCPEAPNNHRHDHPLPSFLPSQNQASTYKAPLRQPIQPHPTPLSSLFPPASSQIRAPHLPRSRRARKQSI